MVGQRRSRIGAPPGLLQEAPQLLIAGSCKVGRRLSRLQRGTLAKAEVDSATDELEGYHAIACYLACNRNRCQPRTWQPSHTSNIACYLACNFNHPQLHTWQPSHTSGASSSGIGCSAACSSGSRGCGEPCGVPWLLLPRAALPAGTGIATCLL